MTSPRTPNPMAVVATVVLALACAGIAFSLLSSLSLPRGLKSRTREVEAAIAQVEAAPREGGDPSTYVQGAICSDPPARAAERLKARLAAEASNAGLAPPKVVVADVGTTDVSSEVTPIMFQLEATGRYDLVLTYLKLLSQSGPAIFADAVDLKSQVSAVSLKLSGRVLCSTYPL